MIECITWPPQSYVVFSVRGRVFEWKDDEPFVSFMRDGSVDTDLARLTPGFVNRVQRYGRQNKIDEAEWSVQQIYFAILEKIPQPLRAKFFRQSESSSPPDPMSLRPHDAPVPAGLAAAAKLNAVADDDPDLPRALAGLAPAEWLTTLTRWVKVDEARQKKSVAGSAWWFALHTVSKNPSKTTTPQHFVGVWLGSFPCRKCRIETRRYLGNHPVPTWDKFEAWANDIHTFINSRRRP